MPLKYLNLGNCREVEGIKELGNEWAIGLGVREDESLPPFLPTPSYYGRVFWNGGDHDEVLGPCDVTWMTSFTVPSPNTLVLGLGLELGLGDIMRMVMKCWGQ